MSQHDRVSRHDQVSRQGSIPRWVLAGLLALAAALHAIVAVGSWPAFTAILLLLPAVAAVGVAFVVPVRLRQVDLLAAIVVGAVGVATFLVFILAALTAGTPATAVLEPWTVAGFLVDTVVVRLAGIVLRREGRTAR